MCLLKQSNLGLIDIKYQFYEGPSQYTIKEFDIPSLELRAEA